MPLVAGIDSSTQSCKVVVRDAITGALVREGRAAHPDGTEVDPEAWWLALNQAAAAAGGLADVAAVSVAAQQHGMVCLDDSGVIVRPALLWNDTRSAGAAAALVAELGAGSVGARAWADAVGSVPTASFTVTKLRWLAEREPANAARTAAVCLPHDWLSWRLAGAGSAELVTDRADASGTGYWAPATGDYRLDLIERALGHVPALPRVVAPAAPAAALAATGAVLGPGTGDNAAAALGLSASVGDLVVSIGTSGVACVESRTPTADPTGAVAGFADAVGGFLPLVCTLNAARVVDATAALLGVDHERFSDLALSAPPGCDGMVLVPYFEGERTPVLPDATGSLHGLRLSNATAAHLARAAIEGVVCGLADAVDALVAQGAPVERVLLIGGGARLEAVRQVAAGVLGRPVVVPEPGEYVADGAARQAAWVLAASDAPPVWQRAHELRYDAEPQPWVRDRYAEANEHFLRRPGTPPR